VRVRLPQPLILKMEMEQTVLQFDAPDLTADQRKVWDVIRRRRGAAQAIPMSHVATLAFGDAGQTRRVQDAVAGLTLAGRPVGSSCGKPNGYYLITDPGELERAIKNLEHRIGQLSRRAAALRRHGPKFAGQGSLTFER